MIDFTRQEFNNSICKECYSKQILKYGKFDIKCDGITVERDVKFAMSNGVSEHDARWLFDTNYFFKKVYGSDPRWYQKPILLCSSRNLVSRQCRQTGKTLAIVMKIMHYLLTNDNKTVLIITPNEAQVKKIYEEYILRDCAYKSDEIKDSIISKTQKPYYKVEFCNGSKVVLMVSGETVRGQCLPADTLISMADGTQKELISLTINDSVLSFNDKTYKIEPNLVTAVHKNGIQDTYKIKTKNGREIVATDNHPFFVKNKWVEVKDISVGDYLAIPKTGQFGVDKLSDDQATVLAYMIGDGSSREKKFSFTNNNMALINDYVSSLASIGDLKARIEQPDKKNNKTLCVVPSAAKISNLYKLLYNFSLLGKYSFEKNIDNKIKGSIKETLKIFISKLFSNDGWASSTLCENIKRGTFAWQLEIGYASTSLRLCKDIQFILTKFGIESCITKKKNGGAVTILGRLCNSKPSYQLKIRDTYNIKRFFSEIGYIFSKEEKCKKIESILSDMQYSNRNLTMMPMMSILKEEAKKYDFHLRSRKLTSIVPISMQRDLVSIDSLSRINEYLESDEIEKIISSDILYDKVISIEYAGKQETYNLTVNNAETFIANNIVTHNSADWIYIDEAAIIGAEMINSILMTIASKGNAAVIMQTSTPKGRGNQFYKACKEYSEYNEYHISIYQVDEMKNQIATFKRQLGETGFKQEAEAEFPDISGGPFNFKGIDLAKQDYAYSDCVREDGIIYFGGVDWNGPAIGSYFYIIGFDPNSYTIKVVDKQVVSSSEWNSIVAKQSLIDLNRKWQCKHWMVDYGYGQTIYEELKLYSMKIEASLGRMHPDSQIKHILETVEFGAIMTIKDPFTKEEQKKTTKSFIVGQFARLFEPNNDSIVAISYSKDDEELTRSLENYKLLNVTARGFEQYGFDKGDGIEDHAQDSLSLAIYGVVKYYGELFRRIIYQAVTIGVSSKIVSSTIEDSHLSDIRGRNLTLISDSDKSTIENDETIHHAKRIGNTVYISRTFGRNGMIRRSESKPIQPRKNYIKRSMG